MSCLFLLKIFQRPYFFFLSLNMSRDKCIIPPVKALSAKTDSIREIFYMVTSTCNLHVHSRQMDINTCCPQGGNFTLQVFALNILQVYFSIPEYTSALNTLSILFAFWNPFISDDVAGMQLLPRSLGASPVAQWVKNLPAMRKTQEMRVRSLGQEGPKEEAMAALFTILAWRIPWTEEPSGLQSIELQKVGDN